MKKFKYLLNKIVMVSLLVLIQTGCASTKTAKLEKHLRQIVASEAKQYFDQHKERYIKQPCDTMNIGYDELVSKFMEWIVKD